MQRNAVTPLENVAGVAAVVALSVVLHVGLMTGSGLVGTHSDTTMLAAGPDFTIAAPNSPDWGHAVLRLNGMN